MTYRITNTYDCGAVGVILTVPVVKPEAGLRLSVPDSRIDSGLRFSVDLGFGCTSYRYIAAEGTGLCLTVSAPEKFGRAGVRRSRLRYPVENRRYFAPLVRRSFALRL
jgi:hypothetical protein